jgi:TPP-dependent pyruvate/acetoin dehydrogenase alpha subunit
MTTPTPVLAAPDVGTPGGTLGASGTASLPATGPAVDPDRAPDGVPGLDGVPGFEGGVPGLGDSPDLGVEPTRLADADLAALLLIRNFEQRLLSLFEAGLLNGTTHTCLGQEYIPVALAPLLRPQDMVFSNHRGHGHYLARYDDPVGLLAEIMGREGAVCSGVGGSQHVYRDGYISSGIQGQSLPIAVGVGLHLKRAQPRGVAVAFIGDGTWGEGAVYEALNMAQLWRVPLLVVVENNAIAQSTPIATNMAGTIAARAAAFGIGHEYFDSTDVNVIRTRLDPVVSQVRAESAPMVVEFRTERLGPHSRGDDARPPQAIAKARAHDWCPRYAERFPDQYAVVDAQARERIDLVVRQVTEQPLARWESA